MIVAAPTLQEYMTAAPPPTRRQGGSGLSNVPTPQPLVSIVTVVRNGAEVLGPTIESVIRQTYSATEYIIVDGASSDATMDVVCRYEHDIDRWISEPDRGIADAWNKGIALSSGQIILILNAGDLLDERCVEQAVRHLGKTEFALTYGQTVLTDNNGMIISTVKGHFNPRFMHLGLGFFHPGCFTTRTVYERVGLYKLHYRMAMDCDWLIRCYRAGVRFKKVNNLTYMPNDGISNRMRYAAYGEFLQVLKDNGFSEQKISMAMIYTAMRSMVKQLLQRQPS